MAFHYTSFEDAQARRGWRMVVVSGIPSPWSEAAKGILHVKDIPWTAVRLDYQSEPLKQWARERNAPVAVFDDERPRAGWAEILLLAERVQPSPALVPAAAADRALAFGLAHEICGEQGLGWTRRLQLVHAGLQGQGGFAEPVARYLAKKYGYTDALGSAATQRLAAILGLLAARLHASRAAGSQYYVGDALSLVDIYSATFMAMLRPLAEDVCAMDAATRAAFATRDAQTTAALDPVLFAHRDLIYREHLELPLAL